MKNLTKSWCCLVLIVLFILFESHLIKMAKDALLEVMTEEIPTSYLESARAQLTRNTEKIFFEKRLRYKKITTYVTSRRLVLYIEGLSEKQDDLVREIIGPPVNVAFDSAGRPLAPAIGFAREYNLPVDSLSRKKTEKGEYVCLRIREEGQVCEKILPEIFIQIIISLNFPKTMVWEETKVQFARPIRNLLALYGNKVIKFSLAGVNSGKYTFGLFPLMRKKIVVTQPARYFILLRNVFVIIDQKERKETIKKLILQVAKKSGGEVYFDSSLLDELTYLVEYPTAVLGNFPEHFLNLPEEIIYTCLIKKQKCFPLLNREKKLLPHFVGIRNGFSEYLEIVQEGYQRVLEARLSDAEFFFKQDCKTSLEEKEEKLKGITFTEQLGTIYDKTIRISGLANWLALKLKTENEKLKTIQRISHLAKADLVSEMVKEYPELQGTMGRIYALLNGEKEEIAYGIEEHLLPLSSDGRLPEREESAIVSIADKTDTLVGDFALGLIPTGSADPYGLRRQATGILRIMKEKDWSVSLRELIERSFLLLPDEVQANSERQTLMDNLFNFLRSRIETLLSEEKFDYDEIAAVLAIGFDDVPATFERARALREIRQLSEFEPLVIAFKRAANILTEAEKNQFQVSSFKFQVENLKEEAEKELWEKFLKVCKEVSPLLEEKKFVQVLKELVSLRESIDHFFEEVMVMSEDVNLRNNRLSMLKNIVDLYLKIANFSLLVVE